VKIVLKSFFVFFEFFPYNPVPGLMHMKTKDVFRPIEPPDGFPDGLRIEEDEQGARRVVALVGDGTNYYRIRGAVNPSNGLIYPDGCVGQEGLVLGQISSSDLVHVRNALGL